MYSKTIYAAHTHYSQKLKLFEESILKDTTLLIAFLKTLIHISKEERKPFFDDIQEFFTEKNKVFKDFLAYFESNWLHSAFIDFKSLNESEINDRTNNTCEGFNRVFNKHIGLKNSPLAMYISKLRELELFCRTRILKKISQGDSNIISEEVKIEKLPFTEIFVFLEKSLKEIEETKYFLRSKDIKNMFVDNL